MRGKGLFAAAAAFAASPQGRRMLQQARDYVRSPEGKQKIADMRGQVRHQLNSRRPGRGPGTPAP